MSTRTPIRFGAIMEAVFAERLSSYERFLSETTSQYLLYGYRRIVVGGHYGFVLVQAARGAGRVGFELGVSKNDTFPYHRLRDYPILGVAGFRESLGFLLKGGDQSEEYHSADALTKLFREFSRELEPAMSRLVERAIPRINQGLRAWQPHYAEWVQAERTARERVPGRYPDLAGETVAYEMLDEMLSRGLFDRYLGPLKYRYRQLDFFNCHVYMLAKGLEFLEPPPLDNPQPITFSEPPTGTCPPLDDPISALTGRFPQELAVDMAVSTSVRAAEFAFLQSLAAVDALLQFDEAGRPKADNGPVTPLPPAESFSLDEPSYVEADLLDAPEYAAPVIAPVAPVQKKPVVDDDDDDPLGALESRLGLR